MATKQPKVLIGLLVFKDQLKKIDQAAKELGISRAAYVRWAVLKVLGER